MKPNCMREPELAGFTEDVSEQRSPFELKHGETLKLDIFIDNSIIEVFVNGRQCVTQVVYPELAESNIVKLFSGDEKVEILGMEAWEMAATNPF
jgi:beta-fructofuranosidase